MRRDPLDSSDKSGKICQYCPYQTLWVPGSVSVHTTEIHHRNIAPAIKIGFCEKVELVFGQSDGDSTSAWAVLAWDLRPCHRGNKHLSQRCLWRLGQGRGRGGGQAAKHYLHHTARWVDIKIKGIHCRSSLPGNPLLQRISERRPTSEVTCLHPFKATAPSWAAHPIPACSTAPLHGIKRTEQIKLNFSWAEFGYKKKVWTKFLLTANSGNWTIN